MGDRDSTAGCTRCWLGPIRSAAWLSWLALGALGLAGSAATVELYRVRAAVAVTDTANGGWLQASFPVENFQRYTSPFGNRVNPVTGRWQFHNGLDIAAPMGSYIRNWWAGKVVELSDHTACGTMVVVQSGQWQHIYCHMQGSVQRTPNGPVLLDPAGGIQIHIGQHVPTSARIGRVGTSGRSTGPHLHWGLKYADRYINPADVLREMRRQHSLAAR
ncbi:membrane protein [Rubidibacter lacunae KORDI 51-2]|uniref:Membrane protein n=1 Tax=Rubidibacter lacunae KORDI 51-2 TaxID=582515 RepID=U5DMV8_9CHRO|nr:M23 family metallopeptidase [Rubidibacter lacunae]ERN43006.1 membrane protein [Rubidibacter lacunae KORDI 51-2]